jgi:hypothetical protein
MHGIMQISHASAPAAASEATFQEVGGSSWQESPDYVAGFDCISSCLRIRHGTARLRYVLRLVVYLCSSSFLLQACAMGSMRASSTPSTCM